MEGNPDIQCQVFRGHPFHVFDHIAIAGKVFGQCFGDLINQVIGEFGADDQVGEESKPGTS